MEAGIRMIRNGKRKNIIVTLVILLVLGTAGVMAFTDAVSKKEPVTANVKKTAPDVKEQDEKLTAKEAAVNLSDSWGADKPQLYYEDDEKIIFAGYFGLFVYSRQAGEIVQSLDLKAIGCDATQGDSCCEINVSKDGSIVYLHPKNEKKMYRYVTDTNELDVMDYELPKSLAKMPPAGADKSSILCAGPTIGDLAYAYPDGSRFWYEPLFYRPYGTCGFFESEDIKDLAEASFYIAGKEYVVTDVEKLRQIEQFLSPAGAKKMKGFSACPFYHAMYFKRKDGTCGKVFPATDSCRAYITKDSCYDYGDGLNEAFWTLFGIDIESVQ